jgi:hypothetical protein
MAPLYPDLVLGNLTKSMPILSKSAFIEIAKAY